MADGRDQIRFSRILQQVRPRARFQRPDHVTLVAVHTQDGDGSFGAAQHYLARRFDSVQVRHGDIHHDYVGFFGRSHVDGLAAIGSFANHL